jgi:hypothetical protein
MSHRLAPFSHRRALMSPLRTTVSRCKPPERMRTMKSIKSMKDFNHGMTRIGTDWLRPGDFGQGFAPFGSTAASVLEASFCAPVSSSPGWEIEIPIDQNFGLSEEKQTSLSFLEYMKLNLPFYYLLYSVFKRRAFYCSLYHWRSVAQTVRKSGEFLRGKK